MRNEDDLAVVHDFGQQHRPALAAPWDSSELDQREEGEYTHRRGWVDRLEEDAKYVDCLRAREQSGNVVFGFACEAAMRVFFHAMCVEARMCVLLRDKCDGPCEFLGKLQETNERQQRHERGSAQYLWSVDATAHDCLVPGSGMLDLQPKKKSRLALTENNPQKLFSS